MFVRSHKLLGKFIIRCTVFFSDKPFEKQLFSGFVILHLNEVWKCNLPFSRIPLSRNFGVQRQYEMLEIIKLFSVFEIMIFESEFPSIRNLLKINFVRQTLTRSIFTPAVPQDWDGIIFLNVIFTDVGNGFLCSHRFDFLPAFKFEFTSFVLTEKDDDWRAVSIPSNARRAYEQVVN